MNTATQSPKPRVAIHKFASCSGCQLAFVNMGTDLIELTKLVDIVHMVEVGHVAPEDEQVDIAFIEGSITTPHDVERLKKIRTNSHYLLTMGACATSGGIQALRNNADTAEWMRSVYAKPEYIESLSTSAAIANHVKVDFELWGCPVSVRQMLAAIRSLGVTRLSLGIEHFDDHILEVNGRAHRSKEVLRAYQYAREIGFPQINIDLIAGMVEETEEKWKSAVAQAVALKPDSVTIYQMEVPYNTGIYQQMKAEGKLVAPVADWETKRRWVNYAFGEFEKIGYTVTSGTTVVRDPAKVKFIYRDGLFSGADILSIGVASFGHLNGVHYQNHHDFDPYVSAVNAGRRPVHRAYTPDAAERYIREFMLQLKLGSVSAERFTQKFGHDPREHFAGPLSVLKAEGFLVTDGDRIGITREGLLQVDRLLHEFFLPQHRTGRYA